MRGFTVARIVVAWFILVQVGSLGLAKGSLGSFGFPLVLSGVPNFGRVHSCSLGFTQASLDFAGFILVRVGSLGRA